MEVLELDIVGSYYYKPDLEISSYSKDDYCTKECKICKRFLVEPSYEMVSDNKNILKDIEVVIGKCGHIFHKDCLNEWHKNCNTCPIDKVKWILHRIADTTTKLKINNYKNKINNYKHKINNYKN